MFRPKMLTLAVAVVLIGVAFTPALAEDVEPSLPLTQSPSMAYSNAMPLTFAQQTARFEAEQRMLRMEWNKWIGYSPLRPNMNASYMSNGLQLYYIPSRSVIVSSGTTRAWYW